MEDFKSSFENADKKALGEYVASLKVGQTSDRPAAGYHEGFVATVLALKVNEAVNTGKRIELKKEWFELV